MFKNISTIIVRSFSKPVTMSIHHSSEVVDRGANRQQLLLVLTYFLFIYNYNYIAHCALMSNSSNAEYIMSDVAPGWDIIELLLREGKQKCYQMWIITQPIIM